MQCTLCRLSLKRCSSALLNDLLFLLVLILIHKFNIFWSYSVIGKYKQMFVTVTLNFGSNKTHKKDNVNNKKKHFICWFTTFKLEIYRVCASRSNIHAFAFAFVTGYLSCQIFLMTFVNWPDKDLRPVADSDIQQNRKKWVPN